MSKNEKAGRASQTKDLQGHPKTVHSGTRTIQPLGHPAPGPSSPWAIQPLVELNGIEPMTSCLQSRRSPN
jgi:hypothetical protein